MISNQQRGRCHLCSQFIRAATRLARPHIAAYIWAVCWLHFSRESWFLAWPNLQKPTVHSQKINRDPAWPTDPWCDLLSALYHTIQHNTKRPRNIRRLLWLLNSFSKHSQRKTPSLLCKENIVGRMWKHLRERFQVVKVRVVHPRIPHNSSVDIERWFLIYLTSTWFPTSIHATKW